MTTERCIDAQDKLRVVESKIDFLTVACCLRDESEPWQLGLYHILRQIGNELAELRGLIADKTL